jgi:hypothetical protein
MRFKSSHGYFVEIPDVVKTRPIEWNNQGNPISALQQKVLYALEHRKIKHYLPDYSGSIIPAR